MGIEWWLVFILDVRDSVVLLFVLSVSADNGKLSVEQL